jgi:CRP-like cAMP-binding protein
MSQTIGFSVQEDVSSKNDRSGFGTSASKGYEVLCGLSPSHKYPPGVELFAQGAQPQDIYFIESGLLKLVSLCENGRELIVCLRSEGRLVGTASAILQKPHLLQATTLIHCNLRRLSAEVFLHMLASSIEFCCYVQRAHSREINEQITPIVELAGYSARNRLERFLWTLSSEGSQPEAGDGIHIRIPLRHWELAQVLAITPAYFSRLLNQMEEEGILERRKGQLVILDAKRLWHGSVC